MSRAGAARASVKKFPTGQSNPTYLIEAASGRYVLRRKPPGKLLKMAHMIEREFRVLKALEGVGYPAPRALALCEDEGVIGTAFYLMAFVDGRVLWDPALPELQREDRAPIYDSMNEGLARLHSIDVAAAGLSDYGKPGSYFARQYQRWTDQYRASETARIEDMERLIAWLADKVPAGRRPRRAGARRLAHRQHDLRLKLAAPACGARLGAVDARPSPRRSCLPVHAMAAAEWPVSRLGRRRPRRERHTDRSRICRRLLQAHGARSHPRLDLSRSPSASFAASRSTRASTSVRSTATPRTRNSPGKWASPCRSWRISPGKELRPPLRASFCASSRSRESATPPCRR